MSLPFGHQHLFNRFRFEGELELVTALHISEGKASEDTDAPFIRTFMGQPYIPGSSLRGAIRSEVERTVATVGNVAGLRSCILFEKGNCPDATTIFVRTLTVSDLEKEEKITTFLREHLCDVCLLFGTPHYASRLVIEDAMPSGIVNGRVRDGVGINRDTGAAHEGAKFDYEAIDHGTEAPRFHFQMIVENATEKDKQLINLVLAQLKSGLHVGGKRAAGLGKVRLKALKVTGFDDPMELWKSLCAGNQDIYKPVTWEEVPRC